MNDELVNKALSGLMTAQAAITASLTRIEKDLTNVKSDVSAAKASSVEMEALFASLRDVMGEFALNSADTQQRLTSLEKENEKLKSDIAEIKDFLEHLKPAS